MKKEKTDSGVSAKMDMTELLQQMESIAAALITPVHNGLYGTRYRFYPQD
jgi:hypothetical protein